MRVLGQALFDLGYELLEELFFALLHFRDQREHELVQARICRQFLEDFFAKEDLPSHVRFSDLSALGGLDLLKLCLGPFDFLAGQHFAGSERARFDIAHVSIPIEYELFEWVLL
ncbi:MAG: hypothetical protein LCH80_18040 [Proteobacteria bacterium]|nr:hypothetical protein [Pseudomonadota bacterium]